MVQPAKYSGGCLCGDVRYELTGESEWNVYCHCRSCRKHAAAPVVAFVKYAPENVRWNGTPRKRYESSEGRFRGFCQNCGTPLTWETEIDGIPWLVFHIVSLDTPEHFVPVEHVFYEERLPWFEIDDELPRHPGSKFI